jgi:hypothetical protein
MENLVSVRKIIKQNNRDFVAFKSNYENAIKLGG